ncbi:hypothetical protein D9613_009661 [Agrocybe pediades]|uniref:Aminopeptidase n=1 Tax=Agrocybe pediades TaxID=84607 RepID=A0A8H4VPX4_9AGAR|nr:hypothetical protein D9613_009661 [Agrocybe pediades]
MDNYRLPTNVKPVHYDLTIKTDLKSFSFQGLVKVDIDVLEDSSSIVLNNLDLDISEAYISSDLTKFEKISSTHTSQERTTFDLPNALQTGSKAQLKIHFSGKLVTGLTGYYKGSFEKDGATKYYAVTQFQPTSARRAFPCWDEPLLKATFAMSMISREGTMNLANMPVISEHPFESSEDVPADLAAMLPENEEDKWTITKFDTTPKMSCYIVAYANGQFDFIESSVVMPLSGKTIPLRIYSTSNIEQAQYVMDVTKAVLPLYEEVFDVEYPLPKLDTFVATDKQGAMENWGLITGQTNGYLIDPSNAGVLEKQRVVSFQSHEIAHMWFGNITTMEWWNYLYLNEGFATLMGEVIIPVRVYPEWRVNSEFIVSHLSKAFNLDAKPSSHPIEVDCPDANNIEQIFDALSYSKAGSVLRMLCDFVGQEKFLKGVSIYLKKHLFGNSVTHDLWEGISDATGINITEIMEAWITKIGFPVLTVTESEQGITVRQDRFLDAGPAKPEDNQTIWHVPLNIVSVHDGERSVDRAAVLHEREKDFAVDTTKPFKLNAGTNGFYRVLYTPERLVAIGKEAIKENSIFSLEDRIGLVDDAVALAKAGLLKLSSSLSLVDLWRDEKEFLVWKSISSSIEHLKSTWWEYPKILEKLNAFSRSLFMPLVKKLGYEYPADESIDTTLLRTLAIEQAFAAEDQSVVTELRRRFKEYQDTRDSSKIPSDLQTVIFTAGVKHGAREDYDTVVETFTKPTSPSEGYAALRALSSTKDEKLILETVVIAFTKARDQDVLLFIRELAKNNAAKRILSKYVQDNYNQIYTRFEASSFALDELLTTPLGVYSTSEDLEAIQKFFKDKDISKYERAYSQALDSIRARIAFIERSTSDLEEWLSKKY